MIDFKQKIEEEERREQLTANQRDTEYLPLNPKSKWITTYTIAIIVLALVFAGRVLISSLNAGDWLNGSFFDSFKHLVPSTDKKLNGEDNDRVNILLLGIGGDGHDGAYLTDTMMLVSLKPSTKQISLISIPRDLVTPVSNWEKINSIDAYAEAKNPGSGSQVTAQAVSTLLQIPVQYYLRVDFNGFINIINELGGIQVNVANTLDDYYYPVIGQEDNPNYAARYQHLHVDKGLQNMDGLLALSYARSRHAYGAEGSDFARAARQQLVLEAVKNKLLSVQTLLNPITITKIISEFNKNISTNLGVWEILRAWNLFKDTNRSQINTQVLSNAADSFLVAGTGQDGAYILTPRSGNFNDIRAFVQNIFSTATTTPTTTSGSISITDQAKVTILNGTWISGLASKYAVLLEQARFNIIKIANAPTRDHTQTNVYDLSGGAKKISLAALENISGAIQSFDKPSWLADYQGLKNATSSSLSTTSPNVTTTNNVTPSTNPEFLLILGTDADKAQ